MISETYEILGYEKDGNNTMAIVLVLQDNEPRAVFHVQCYGFKIPESDSDA